MSAPRDVVGLMDTLIGWILLAGVSISVVLLSLALVWQWVVTGSPALTFALPGTSLVSFLLSLGAVTGAASAPQALADLGLAVLMLTPYVRVLASVVFFAFVEHDWKYVAFTSFVGAVLTYSLFLR